MKHTTVTFNRGFLGCGYTAHRFQVGPVWVQVLVPEIWKLGWRIVSLGWKP